jgi:hypothetical protein
MLHTCTVITTYEDIRKVSAAHLNELIMQNYSADLPKLDEWQNDSVYHSKIGG